MKHKICINHVKLSLEVKHKENAKKNNRIQHVNVLSESLDMCQGKDQ